MKRDSRLSSVLHVLLHMAQHDGPLTSDTLPRALGTNPVLVRPTPASPHARGPAPPAQGPGRP